MSENIHPTREAGRAWASAQLGDPTVRTQMLGATHARVADRLVASYSETHTLHPSQHRLFRAGVLDVITGWSTP